VEGTATVPVVYRGSVPDQFKLGREVRLEGRQRSGVFVGKPGTLVTKCPSKYTAEER
jgi:cytochrome c-type biogenesis protein CcmE